MIQLPQAIRSTKGKLIAGAGACVVVLLLVVGTLAVTRNSSDESSQQADGGSTATTTADSIAPGTPTGTTGEASPTTTAPATAKREADANATGEPQSQPFRAPVRCSADGAPKTGALPGEDANNGKRWVTVQSLSGACDKSSSEFALKGIDTRLAWRTDASNFNAFLVDTNDADAAAGYADADCAGPCAEYQSLTNKAAKYTLRVQADGGPWEVLVQEYR